jgi:hypothetical protein
MGQARRMNDSSSRLEIKRARGVYESQGRPAVRERDRGIEARRREMASRAAARARLLRHWELAAIDAYLSETYQR